MDRLSNSRIEKFERYDHAGCHTLQIREDLGEWCDTVTWIDSTSAGDAYSRWVPRIVVQMDDLIGCLFRGRARRDPQGRHSYGGTEGRGIPNTCGAGSVRAR